MCGSVRWNIAVGSFSHRDFAASAIVGLRLDAKGERFIALSDKGSWFTGRIVYKGREMIGLDNVEASPMLAPTASRLLRAAGSTASRSRSMDRWSMSGWSASISYSGSICQGFTRAIGEVMPLPPAARKLPFNKGSRRW